MIELLVTLEPITAKLFVDSFRQHASELRRDGIWYPSARIWAKRARDHSFLVELDTSELSHFSEATSQYVNEQNPSGRTVLLVNLLSPEDSLLHSSRLIGLRNALKRASAREVRISLVLPSPREMLRIKYASALLRGEVRLLSLFQTVGCSSSVEDRFDALQRIVQEPTDRLFLVHQCGELPGFWHAEYGSSFPPPSDTLAADVGFILRADPLEWEARRIANALFGRVTARDFQSVLRMLVAIDPALLPSSSVCTPEFSSGRRQIDIGDPSRPLTSVKLSEKGWEVISLLLHARSAAQAQPNTNRSGRKVDG
jgi:hypothetical protein